MKVAIGRVAVVLIASLAIVAPAGARAVRSGLSLELLSMPGMERLEVVAPDDEEMPVRVSFGAPQRGVELVVDVRVAIDAAAANEAFESLKRDAARELAPASGVGDAAVRSGSLVVLVRDNIAVRVHRVRGSADVLAAARRIDEAILASPIGVPRALVPRLRHADPQIGETVTLVIEGDVVGAELAARGPARLRRTAGGWLLTRTAPGRIEIAGTAVDSRLRVSVL